MARNKKKLILIQLNELNFELVDKYSKKYNLKYLKHIINQKKKNYLTYSENIYDLLEPWIQWFSVYSGKAALQHGVYRLGDCKNYKDQLLFNKIENLNFKVGAISPMNLSNDLKNPSYFIPDPWTDSTSDNSFWSKKITSLLRIAVNNNSGNIFKFSTIVDILLIFIKFSNIYNYKLYLFYLITSIKFKWRKALFLDLLINDIHLKLLRKNKPNFSSVFFNAGAHIQHHHLLKSEFFNEENNIDPIKDSCYLYNTVLKNYLLNKNMEYEYVIFTGLSQDINKDPVYYYRLKNHQEFLKYFNIKYSSLMPRMSRDFEIKFDNQDEAENAAKKLSSIITVETNSLMIFETIDIREKSLFVTLTYPKKINKNLKISDKNKYLNFYENVNFVAEKNGIHSQKGYLFYSESLSKLFGTSKLNVKDIHNIILNYFNA